MMKNSGLNDKKYFGLLLGLMAFLFVMVNFIGPDPARKVLIDGDGSGLYAYLPALTIYRSVDFTPVLEAEKQRRPPDYQGHYFHRVNGTLINKFTVGQALLQLPFFILAWLLSLLTGLEADGYNIFFQYAVALAALFWTMAGLLFFVKLARTYGVSKDKSWLMAFAGLLGTNLVFYALVAPSHSHAYSFAMVSITLYFVRKSFLTQERKHILYAAFWFGLVVLVRPVNVLLAAGLPFLAGSARQFGQLVKSKLTGYRLVEAVLVLLLALSPQLVINYLQTGSPVIYGYKNEGFYFDDPQILNFLFSFRKGWFVYTPFMLLLFPALVRLFRQSRYIFYTFSGFIILVIYVFSSWWNWFYGDSFGMRPMVDFYALFFLVILLMVNDIKRKTTWWSLAVFTGLAVFLNMFQTWQYAAGIIHPDAMNRKAYAYVFLRMDQSYKNAVAGCDESFYGKLNEAPFFKTQNDLEGPLRGWTANPEPVSSGNSTAAKLTAAVQFSPSFEYNIPVPEKGKQNIYIVFETKYLEPEPNAASQALFVVDVKDTSGKTVFYKTFKMKRLPDQLSVQWREAHIGFKIPDFTDELSSIKLYIWNKEKQTFLLDDLAIRFYTYRQ